MDGPAGGRTTIPAGTPAGIPAGLHEARFALGLAAVAAWMLPLCFFAMFSGFGDHDDEGYLLLSLRQYAQGGVLYDQLYSQYGPAYFQAVTGLFSVLGLPVTHAAGRAVVVGLWLATALVCGAATYRLTANRVVAWVAALLVGLALAPLRNEPLHPGGVLGLVVSALVLSGAGTRRATGLRGAALGVCVGVALLMKVNIGLFAGVAAGFAVLARLGSGWARPAAAAAFLLVPPAVMAGLLSEEWVRAYLVLVMAGTVSVVLVELSQAATARGARGPVGMLLAASAVTLLLVCGWELGRGSSVEGLARGIVLDPLSHPYVLALPPLLSPAAPVWALTSLAACLSFLLLRRTGWSERWPVTALRGPAQMLAGAFIWLAATDRLLVSPLAALPLLWVALLTPAAEVGAARSFGRSLLVAVAALQALHAYPVAGSQVAWGTFLFIPVGAVAIADGWRATVAAVRAGRPDARWPGPVAWVLGAVLVGLAASAVYDAGQRYRHAYEDGVSLGLPGAESIRVAPRQATLYRALTANLAAHCATFVTMPGLNSLYLFTRLEPPTMMNATVWMSQFTSAQQLEIARRLSSLTVPTCAVRRLRATWRNPGLYATPLGRFMDTEFETVLV
ncbi:MAG: hypothetical protein ACREMB_27830, partial [Candidatus Rokuibacteriota bacterium]